MVNLAIISVALVMLAVLVFVVFHVTSRPPQQSWWAIEKPFEIQGYQLMVLLGVLGTVAFGIAWAATRSPEMAVLALISLGEVAVSLYCLRRPT
jgi:hypothetical protein